MLAEPDRLAVFAAVVLGAGTVTEASAATGLDARSVGAAVRRLTSGGPLHTEKGQLTADAEVFKQARREAVPSAQPEPQAGVYWRIGGPVLVE